MSDPISSYAATGLAFEFTGTCKLLHPAKYEDGDTIVDCGWGVADLLPIFRTVKMMCSPNKGILLPSLPFLNKLQSSFHCWYSG